MAASGNRDRQTEDSAAREERDRSRKGEGLIGDEAENRNLTGSSTWETLPDQQGDGSGAKRDHKHESRDDPGRANDDESTPG